MKVYVFCHIGAKRPNGGVKILFEYAQALIDNGYDASILIPGAHLYPSDCPKGYKPSWFETTVPVYDDVRIITKDDIVLMHEESVWCFDHISANNPRIIMINQGLSSSITNNVSKNITYNYVRDIYSKCLGVIAISPYIVEGVKKIFGVPEDRIYHIENPVDDFFKPGKKENNILVMNKQQGNVATTMILKIIEERYPNWNVKYINDMTMGEVAHEMSIAKIFLFFCAPLGEGSSLPPVEAALSGCKVIGYTGVSSDYYYNEPIFTKVDYNDIVTFIRMTDYYTGLYGGNDFDLTYKVFHQSTTSPHCTENLRQLRSKSRFKQEVNRVFKELING